MVLRKIILIPFEKYTRSSLVTGIFAAHGCWTGETKKLGYDTFENRQLSWWMAGATADGELPSVAALAKMLRLMLPEKGHIVLKVYWKWFDLFREALGEEVYREFYPTRLDKRTYKSQSDLKKKGVVHIDTDILVRHIFKQMKPAIIASGLQWDEDKANSVFVDGMRRIVLRPPHLRP